MRCSSFSGQSDSLEDHCTATLNPDYRFTAGVDAESASSHRLVPHHQSLPTATFLVSPPRPQSSEEESSCFELASRPLAGFRKRRPAARFDITWTWSRAWSGPWWWDSCASGGWAALQSWPCALRAAHCSPGYPAPRSPAAATAWQSLGRGGRRASRTAAQTRATLHNPPVNFPCFSLVPFRCSPRFSEANFSRDVTERRHSEPAPLGHCD